MNFKESGEIVILSSLGEWRMSLRLFIVCLAFCLSGCAALPTTTERESLVGTWRLESRIDRTSDGREPVEPNLGRDPVAILTYDSKGNVSAQLMRRDRLSPIPLASSPVDPNNSAARGGYDAYFGTYSISGRTVTHVLEAALDPNDVGRRLIRNFSLKGDKLTIYFSARGSDSSNVTRTLTWCRVAP